MTLRSELIYVKVAQSCSTVCNPMDYTVLGILQARILEWVAFPFSGGSSKPKDRTQISRIVANSLAAEPQGKPKKTGVGSLSLLQGVFPTQESNWGLLHCRRIIYQLSYEKPKWKSLPLWREGLETLLSNSSSCTRRFLFSAWKVIRSPSPCPSI